jgi:ABC-type nitrate/sulfonate/bicarbonate transport system substrate-binding protein
MKSYVTPVLAAVLIAACVAAWLLAHRVDVGTMHAEPSLSSSSPTAPAAAPRGPVIRFGIPRSCHAAPFVLARRKGLFNAEGLEVQLMPFRDAKTAFTAMFTGKADLILVADLPIAGVAQHRRDERILTKLEDVDFDRWIAAKPAIKSIVELRGKRVGTQKGSGPEYMLDDILARNGLHESDVKVVDVPEEMMVRGISNGELDAFVVVQPFSGSATAHFGVELRELADPHGYRRSFSLVGRAGDMESRGNDFVKAMHAIAGAIDALKADRAASLEGVEADPFLAGRVVVDDCSLLLFAAGLDEAFIKQLSSEAAWFSKNGDHPNPNPPDMAALLAPAPLRGARQGAATIPNP